MKEKKETIQDNPYVDTLPPSPEKGGLTNKDITADMTYSVARCLLPLIQSYFESAEGQKAFAEWKSREKSEEEK